MKRFISGTALVLVFLFTAILTPMVQAAPPEATLKAAYKAYYDELKERVDASNVEDEFYVSYAGLIRVSGDEEIPLLVIGEYLGYYDADIVYGYKSGEIVCYASGGGGDVSAPSVGFYTTGNGRVYVVQTAPGDGGSDGDGDALEYVSNYYTLRNNEWVSELVTSSTTRFDFSGEEPVTETYDYKVNGVPVTQEVFDNASKKELDIVGSKEIDKEIGSVQATLDFLKAASSTSQVSQTVNPTASTVYLNGDAKPFEAYNIGGNNYFKLRDLALVLSGTQKQFEIGYDEATKAITLTSGKSYTPVGGEMKSGDGKSKTATPTASKIYLDGEELTLAVYNIGGNNFFKLRDFMAAVDVYVGYDDSTKAITLDTSRSYVAE